MLRFVVNFVTYCWTTFCKQIIANKMLKFWSQLGLRSQCPPRKHKCVKKLVEAVFQKYSFLQNKRKVAHFFTPLSFTLIIWPWLFNHSINSPSPPPSQTFYPSIVWPQFNSFIYLVQLTFKISGDRNHSWTGATPNAKMKIRAQCLNTIGQTVWSVFI